jgi:hypothetical protein
MQFWFDGTLSTPSGHAAVTAHVHVEWTGGYSWFGDLRPARRGRHNPQ